MKNMFRQFKTYILIVVILVIITISTVYGIKIVYTSVDDSQETPITANSSKDDFNTDLKDMRYFQKANSAYKNSDSKQIVANNDKRIVSDIESILKNKESLKYDNLDLQQLLSLKVYDVVGDDNARIIRYTTNSKVYGENDNGTYEFFQSCFNDKIIVKKIISGQDKLYDKFYMIIVDDKDKKLLCLGSDYSKNPNAALIEAFDYNLEQTADKVKALLTEVTDTSIPWYINSVDGTIKVGEAKLEGTYISDVRDNGREIYVGATDECKRYLGYDPGKLKIILKCDSYVPICSDAVFKNEHSLMQTEKKMINTVKNLREVKEFINTLKNNKQKSIITIESVATEEMPVWRIRVAQDYYDHISTYNIYSVNALTGKVISKDFDW